MNEFNLQVHGISRAEKVAWRFPAHATEVLALIKSKSLRKFLSTAEDLMASSGITVEYKKLSDEDFLNWLPYYSEKMLENGYDVIASPEWLAKKKVQQVTLEGMFFYKDQKLVGSGIFTRNENKKSSFAFKASERINIGSESHSSLGAVIDYLYLKEMVKQKVEVISAGRSRNAFGVVNTLGYLDYKLRFGYEPYFGDNETMLETVPLNDDGIVLFYGKKEGKLSLYAVKPTGEPMHFESSRFSTPELPFVEIEY